jgi:hypothetical protein
LSDEQAWALFGLDCRWEVGRENWHNYGELFRKAENEKAKLSASTVS